MRSLMMVLPAQNPEAGPGDNLFAWSEGDHAVLEFRFRHHHETRDDDFAGFVADALVGDAIDADVMWRAVVSCNSLREFPGMVTGWLIENCDVDHTLKKDLKKP